MHFHRFFSLDELAESIEAFVTAEDVQRVAQSFFRRRKNVALTVLGNLGDGFKITRDDLV